jgi:hypothetical protein
LSLTRLEKHLFDSNVPFLKRFEEVFAFQYEKNSVYRTFLNALGYTNKDSFTPKTIPLLPVRAFKGSTILPDGFSADLIFRSSGTLAMQRSSHGIAKPEIYEKTISTEFYKHFPKEDVSILGLLPKYEDNPDSSLIWMVRYLVNSDMSGLSCFIHQDTEFSREKLSELASSNKKILLFGAAFGLIDFMKRPNPFQSLNLEVIETGGMKTHKREMSKGELRDRIAKYFGIPLSAVHSEYGMCELHSQMYAIGSEWFTAPHWVKVSIRDAENPERECEAFEEGKIGIIDLANLYSCPFILTNDRGLMNENGEFQVLGRWDLGNMRGCNFLIDAET